MARGCATRYLDTNYHYLKLEADASTKPTPNFSGFLDKVKRGQSAVGAEHAVPIILGAPNYLSARPNSPLQ